MKSKGALSGVALVAVALAIGCARHVVVEPEQVPSENSRDWRVQWKQRLAAPPGAPAPAPGRDTDGAAASRDSGAANTPAGDASTSGNDGSAANRANVNW